MVTKTFEIFLVLLMHLLPNSRGLFLIFKKIIMGIYFITFLTGSIANTFFLRIIFKSVYFYNIRPSFNNFFLIFSVNSIMLSVKRIEGDLYS